MALILDFGKYRGTALEEVPNTYLGWLTKWDVGRYCGCKGEECDDDCETRPAKIRRVVKTRCSSEVWVDGERVPCDSSCTTCSSLQFLVTRPEIVNAARDLATRRRLCAHCWRTMPPIGNARSNGAPHADWSTRFLHKACWSELMNDE